ncbi:hypothetical protein B0H13DRAFT_1628219 [Mycena leptocephala]|nr:hypothetical protein B0H13DRAFT_1628219 [Mycena leptocephala]
MQQPDSQGPDDESSSQRDFNALLTQASSSIPSTPSTTASKKRPSASLTADGTSKKKARFNAQEALFSVGSALNTFGERMSTATRELMEVLRTSNTNSSPERRARALEVVHRETWLPLPDRIRLGRLVGKGQTADEYMSWSRAGSPERKTSVCMTLGYDPDYYQVIESIQAS